MSSDPLLGDDVKEEVDQTELSGLLNLPAVNEETEPMVTEGAISINNKDLLKEIE